MTSKQIFKLATILDLRVKSEDTSISYSARDIYRSDYYMAKSEAIDEIGQEKYDEGMNVLESLLKK